MRTFGAPSASTVPSAKAVGSGRRSRETALASFSNATKRSIGLSGISAVTAEDRTNHAAQHRAAKASSRRPAALLDVRRRDDAVRQARERQRLEQYAAWSAEPRKEQSFPAEERRLHAGHHFDVVLDPLLHGHEAPGVDAQRFARRQPDLVQRAARVQEDQAIGALDPLENEPFAAKKSGADSFRERDGHVHTPRRAQEAVLLRDDDPAPLGQLHRPDLAGKMRREGDVL